MPLREGGAKLWFNTKQEQDQFDDKMIASVVIQSPDYEDSNFTPIFFRKREENHFRFTEFAKKEVNSFLSQRASYSPNLYGKRDHTYWRDIAYVKYGMSYVVGYLLLRELPVRNLYARAWIMLAALGLYLDVAKGWIGKGGIKLVDDPFLNKDIKNYGVYDDLTRVVSPGHDNQLPEHRLWKLNQPGHLAIPSQRYPTTAFGSLFESINPKQNLVPWDGTFNMPLDALAHPKHKDAQWIDFLYA